jgi:glucose/arabinose dehydrogenase
MRVSRMRLTIREGFLTRQKDGTFVEFGRPTSLAVAKDGALLAGHEST